MVSNHQISLGLPVVAPNSSDNFLYLSATFHSILVGKYHAHTLDGIAFITHTFVP